MRHSVRPSALLLALVLAPSCRVLDAKVSNLREVHEPDGSPDRVATVRNDFQYLLSRALDPLNFQGPDLLGGDEEPIDDPHGVCLENLIDLAACDGDDPRVLGYQSEFFSWLAVDDHSRLSRERCVLGLASVGRRLGVEAPAEAPEGAVSATEVADALGELVRVLRPWIRGEPGADREALEERCRAVRDLALDREGARRLVAALNLLLERSGRGGDLAPALALHRELQGRAVALALGAALSDADPLVRAAAVRSCADLGAGLSFEHVRKALQDPDARVLDAGLSALALHGAPSFPEDAEERAEASRWLEGALVQHAQSLDDPVSVAACRALARLNPEERPDLRPEVWTARRDARGEDGRPREATASEAP